MPSEPDPSRCPLCGVPNGCAAAAGVNAAECWCMKVEITAELLARVPEAAREKACVCAECVRRAKAEPTARPLRTVAGS